MVESTQVAGKSMSSTGKQFSSLISFNTKGRKDHASSAEVRLVLLGKTGSGKSSTANSILGRKFFESKAGSSSVTLRCRRACGEFRGRHVTLLDTPGPLDTQQTPGEVQAELRRSVALLFPGPHAFLLVVRIGRFTREEREAVEGIERALGPGALAFSVVVFTHGDSLDEGASARSCLLEQNQGVAALVAKCGGRYCVFNNHTSKTKEQVSELLALVDRVTEASEGCCYTAKMLQEAQDEMERGLQAKMKALKEKEELEKEEQEEAMRRWYQGMLETIQLKNEAEMEELRRSLEVQREKEEELAREREQAAQMEREKYERKEKERKVQEMVKVMELRQEEDRKREALQEELGQAAAALKEQTEREKSARRELEEALQRHQADSRKRERERDEQHLQKERAVRRREELKREALQQEVEHLARALEEHAAREEALAKENAELLEKEREEARREVARLTELQRAEKKKSDGLLRQLNHISVKIEEQRVLKREAEERLQREKGRGNDARPHRNGGGPQGQAELKHSAREYRIVTTIIKPVSGYAHEMGVVAVNAALESVPTTCCIQ